MHTVIIKRSEWGTGDLAKVQHHGSMLYNSETGLKCCLGFMCEALGVPTKRLDGLSYPWSLQGSTTLRNFLHHRFRTENIFAILARINDAGFVVVPQPIMGVAGEVMIRNRDDREALIKEWGAKIDIDFQFVD